MASATCKQHPINPVDQQNMECARLKSDVVSGEKGLFVADCKKGDGADGWTNRTRRPAVESDPPKPRTTVT